MGFMDNDLNKQRPATASTPFADFTPGNERSAASTDAPAPQGNSNSISESVAQHQKDVENAFQAGLQEPPKQEAASPVTQAVSAPSSDNAGAASTAPTSTTTTTQPQGGDVASATTGAIDWSKPYAEIEKNEQLRKMTPHDIMRDFQKYGDGNWAVFMPWLQKYDPDKTVEQSVKDAEKARKQAKWERLGNLFQHVSNFFGTAIGAPSQKIESATELKERQRKLREGTDALRAKGYDQMLANIYKDRADKRAQIQAEVDAKAKQAEADYKGAQKKQVEAMTPEKLKTEQAKQAASNAAAGLSTAKTKTEDELRGAKGKLITAQTDKAKAGVAVAASTVAKNNAQTKGQNLKNAAAEEADVFNDRYVNEPEFNKYVKIYAANNGLAVGENKDGRGGTWSNDKNRQQATKFADAMIAKNGKKRTVRPFGGKPAKGSGKTTDYSKYRKKK